MASRKFRNMEEFSATIGVSRPTVSKYFSDPASVRTSIRERIEQALKEHNYRPNIYAVNQNRSSTRTLGILVPYLADPFFAEMARQLERLCIKAGYAPLLFSAHGKRALENEALDSLRDLKPSGALIAPIGRRSDREAMEAFCEEIPTVLFDSDIDGVGEAFIGLDNGQSIGMIVEYLCRTGEPPCLLEMPPVNPNANKRREAYIAAMHKLGHEPQVIHVAGRGWDFEAAGYIEGKRLIDERSLASDTVLCSNDRIAIGLLSAAYEKGLRVGSGNGHALRVAGHDDHPFSRYTCPPLTTVAQDYGAITRRACEALLERIDAPASERRERERTLFAGRLIRRESA